MTTNTSYRVRAEWEPWPDNRDPGVWILTVDEVANAVTQVAHLSDVTEVVADLLSVVLDRDIPSSDVDLIDIDWPGSAGNPAAGARAARRQAEALAAQAQEATSKAIGLLAADKIFTTADIGVIVGLSGQRVRQILAERKMAEA